MQKFPYGLSAAAIAGAGLLSACGGGGSGGTEKPPEPLPTANSVADSYTLDWNAAKRLSVLDNDSSSGGIAKLSLVESPKNGTATVEDGVLLYTPKAGFFGEDSLRYRLTVGTASSEAAVKLSVEASLTVEGVVSDAPIANAKVQLNAGSKSVTADADANGRYSVVFKTAEPGAFVRLSAQGQGTQSHVVLESLVGEAKSLAAVSPTGKVSAAQWPALNITHLSSAQVGLLTQRGTLPSSDAELSTRIASISAFEILDAAALIKLLVDDQVPLPAGAKSTQELLNSASLYPAFSSLALKTYDTRIEKLQQGLSADPALSSAMPKPATDGLTLLYVSGLGGGAIPASRITLQADGSALVVDSSVKKGRWTHESNQITVLYDEALIYKTTGSKAGYPGLGNASANNVVTGFQIREMGGMPSSRILAAINSIGYLEVLEGSSSGQRIPSEAQWWANWRYKAKQPFSTQDFAAGKRWAGPLSARTSMQSGQGSYQDVMLITGPGTGRMERSGENFNWSIEDGDLLARLSDGSYRYQRMGKDPSGAERWLVEQSVNGVVSSVAEIMAVEAVDLKVDAPMMARKWNSNVNAQSWQDTFFSLRSDGAVGLVGLGYKQQEYAPTYQYGTWDLKADGSVMLYTARRSDGKLCTQEWIQTAPPTTNPDCKTSEWHQIKMVGKNGRHLFAMDKVSAPNFPISYRLIALTDSGEVK